MSGRGWFLRNPTLWFVAAILALCAMSSVVVVGENQQVVITRMGNPDRVVNRFRNGPADGAGVVLKLPFLEQAVWIDRGLVGHTLAGQRLRSKDGTTLAVDTDVTYRVIDPVRLVNKLGSPERLGAQLDSLLPDVIATRLGQLDAAAIVLPGSSGAATAMLVAADAKARDYGVQIVDLRVGRALPAEQSYQDTLALMQSHHLSEVDQIKQASVQESLQIRADVDAETARIKQQGEGKDPQFYEYFRALRSYEATLGNPDPKKPPTIVIPPDGAYLRHFNGK